MFTMRHYEELAKFLKQAEKEMNSSYESTHDVFSHLQYKLADFLGKDNPKFKKEKFLKACDERQL